MTADAILVTGDSKRVLELQRPQQENGNIACNGLSPDDKHNSHGKIEAHISHNCKAQKDY